MSMHIAGKDTVYFALRALKSAHRATFSHSVRTARVAVKLAAKLYPGLYLAINDIKDAALFHDIGKLFVPVHILEKDGALTILEREHVVPHPIWGEQILLESADPRVRNLARFVREHHELADGSGYPAGLTLDEIAPVSRVINIADRFAALTENRPYRKALVPEFAIEFLRADIGHFFGLEAAKVVDVLAGFRSKALPGQTHDAGTSQAPAPALLQAELELARLRARIREEGPAWPQGLGFSPASNFQVR
jgi:HD-GYP domain-containing protein (c-di-GMP phosphodiesterase class II)